MTDREPQHHRIDRAVRDALRVAEVLVGAVLDSVLLLQPHARPADLAGGPVERAADARIRLELQHARAAFGRADRERQAGCRFHARAATAPYVLTDG